MSPRAGLKEQLFGSHSGMSSTSPTLPYLRTTPLLLLFLEITTPQGRRCAPLLVYHSLTRREYPEQFLSLGLTLCEGNGDSPDRGVKSTLTASPLKGA